MIVYNWLEYEKKGETITGEKEYKGIKARNWFLTQKKNFKEKKLTEEKIDILYQL